MVSCKGLTDKLCQEKKQRAKENSFHKRKLLEKNENNNPDANKGSKYSDVLNKTVGINEEGNFDNIERESILGKTVPAAKLESPSSGGKTKRRSKKSKKSKKKRRTRRKGKKSRKSRK